MLPFSIFDLLLVCALFLTASASSTTEEQGHEAKLFARTASDARSLAEQFPRGRVQSIPPPSPQPVSRALKQATRADIVARTELRKAGRGGRRSQLDTSPIADPCSGLSDPTRGQFQYGVLINAVNFRTNPPNPVSTVRRVRSELTFADDNILVVTTVYP